MFNFGKKKKELEEQEQLNNELIISEEKAQEEADAKARIALRDETERRVRAAAAVKAKEAEIKSTEEVVSSENTELAEKAEETETNAKEEAKAKEEAEAKAKEETEAKAKEEAETKAKEEAETKAKEEAETKAKEEAETKTQEEVLNEEDEPTKKKGFFSKLVDGLSKTRDNLIGGVEDVLNSFKTIDEDFYEELEEALIMADLGVNTTLKVIEDLRVKVKENKITTTDEVRVLLKDELKSLMFVTDDAYDFVDQKTVLLVIGVNGVGKTTTIGKLSNQYKQAGKSVMLAAADTFRAAAIDQLKEWATRADVPLIAQGENSDPGAVIYDAIQSAKAKDTDILICDTAGRLHNKKNLMDELNKIYRIIEREYGDAHKEVLLVLDATTGQNAVQQAKLFKEAADITGVVLTKLDGTAKGGIAIAIQSELRLPVKYIGIGEGIDDMRPFNSDDFIDALFNDRDIRQE